MYYLLTASFKSNEEKLVAIIQEAVAVDKIYMLGSTLMSQRTESVFMPDAPSRSNASHYWLLILIGEGNDKNAVQDKIENNCQHFIPVTALVLQVQEFDRWLTEGHRFTCTVMQRAVLLCDNSKLPPAPAAPMQQLQQNTTAVDEKGSEFLAGAALYVLRRQNKMAAFMLHQAAEHTLHAFFRSATGLHISTHNIGKLLRYTAMVNYKIATVFIQSDTTDMALLTLLQSAYIDTRYKDGKIPSAEQLTALTGKVASLISMLKNWQLQD